MNAGSRAGGCHQEIICSRCISYSVFKPELTNARSMGLLNPVASKFIETLPHEKLLHLEYSV